MKLPTGENKQIYVNHKSDSAVQLPEVHCCGTFHIYFSALWVHFFKLNKLISMKAVPSLILFFLLSYIQSTTGPSYWSLELSGFGLRLSTLPWYVGNNNLMWQRNCLKTCRKIKYALKPIFNHINFVFRSSSCRATCILVHLFLSSTAKWQQNLWYIATLNLFMHWLWTKILLMKKQTNPFPQLIRSTCSMVRISSSLLLFIAFHLPHPTPSFPFSPNYFHLYSASTSHIMQFQHDSAQVIFLPEATCKAW